MSVRVMAEVWADPPVAGNELLLLLALADNADEDRRTCWPSVATLMRKTQMSRRTVFRVLDQLEAKGLLWREHREGHSTVYHVLDGGCQSDTGATDGTGRGATGGTGGVSPVTPRTVKEPPEGTTTSLAPDGATDQEAESALFPGPSLPAVSTKARRRDELFEALMVVAGVDLADIPPSARGAYNRARADLAAVGATPEEVIRRGAIFRATWPDIRLTPTALARRWAEVGAYVPNSTAHAVRMQAEQHDLIARMRALDEREAM